MSLLLWFLTGCAGLPGAGPAAIWIVPGEAELNTDTPPLLENDIYSASRRELRLIAALNETVSFQIGLASPAPPAGPFEVRISDFAGPGGLLAAREVTMLYRAHYSRVERYPSWYPGHTGRPATPALFPDVLVPWNAPRGGGPIKVDEARNEVIWVDVAVPPTIEAGEYASRIEVLRTGTGEVVFHCNISLDVQPIAIPVRRGLPVVARVDPRALLQAHVGWRRPSAEQTLLLPEEASHAQAVAVVNGAMRLLQSHRLNPVLWASFPKFRPLGEREVEVEWADYDQLVSGWLDGSSFADRVPLDLWPLPVSLDHPSADRNDGFGSPAYARLLSAYLTACRAHFAEREWLPRAIVRPVPPGPLTPAAFEQLQRIGGIVQGLPAARAPAPMPDVLDDEPANAVPTPPPSQAMSRLRLLAHLPARSLRGLGWQNAPFAELSEVAIWAPPAMWYEPAVMQRERGIPRQTWFLPDVPPYSPSLAVAAPASDAHLLAWQAFRYGSEGIWIEDAAPATGRAAVGHGPALPGDGLLYPGEPYGLASEPVPSRRLKRLRRGLQDYELLTLLARSGKQLLAQSLAEQVVTWGFTDACTSNLLTTRAAGWPADPTIPALARILILQELVGDAALGERARTGAADTVTRWGVLMNQAQRVRVEPVGVQLSAAQEGFSAHTVTALSNFASRPINGAWRLDAAPAGWEPQEATTISVNPFARHENRMEISIPALAPHEDGAYPFALVCETDAFGPLNLPLRLAATSAPLIDTPPRVDGDLEDWAITPANTAGDFRLVTVPTRPQATPPNDRPTLPTQAFFCQDGQMLYIAVRCALPEGERPLWESDNQAPLDGALPWGQELVEVLIDPRPTREGPSSHLYCLQVKPSGLLIARRGCRTEPPIGASEEWRVDATAAAAVRRGAWVAEIAVPLAAFGADALRNRIWGVNVTRLDARRGEYASWSGARGHCYQPATLGNLLMPGAD